MAYNITATNTGTTVDAQLEQRKIWKKGVDIFEQSYDFFASMEGKSDRSIIRSETDVSKGKGQKIKFTNMSGLYKEGKRREELFENDTDFEKLQFNEYEMAVDYLRHGVRCSDRMEEFMGMRGEIKNGLPVELGKWLGRMKTEFMFMQMLHEKDINPKAKDSYIFAGEKGGVDDLVSADVLQWDEIVSMGNIMKRLGGKSAYVGKAGQNKLFRQCVLATNDALFSFETDTDYKNYLRDTNDTANAKYLFDGGFTDVRGNVIKEYTPIDHDGYGAVASPLNPKAFLGEEVNNGSEVVLKGGGDAEGAGLTDILYFKYFPAYKYEFLDGQSVPSVDGSHYALIINPADGSSEANKWGLVEYTVSLGGTLFGNNGNQITIKSRLGSSIAGTRNTTVGNVTWGTAPFVAGSITETYLAGATIVPCNASGVAFGKTLMLGANACYRGYGKYRNQRSQEVHNGGFVKDIFVTSVFGQRPRLDRKLRMPSITVLTHALELSGIPLPNVT